MVILHLENARNEFPGNCKARQHQLRLNPFDHWSTGLNNVILMVDSTKICVIYGVNSLLSDVSFER